MIYPQQIQTKLQNDALIYSNCWFYPTGEKQITKLASDNVLDLYISFLDGKFISLKLNTAEKLWETNLAGNIVSDTIVDNKNIYITAQKPFEPMNIQTDIDKIIPNEATKEAMKENLILYSLDKVTGITRWQIKIASSEKVYLYDTGDSLTVILTNGVVYSIAKTDGQLLWLKSLESDLSARPFKKPTEIVLGTIDKRITYLSLKDGNTLQKVELSEQSAIIAEDVNGNNLIVGDRKGSVWSISKKKRKRNWTLRQGAEISSLLITSQGLLISSFDNFVYLISEASGKLIWKKRLPGRIAAKPQIRDNNIIISSIDESAAFVIELNSGKLVNKITLESDNFFAGESIQLKNLFIYATRRGIFSFSLDGEGCRLEKN